MSQFVMWFDSSETGAPVLNNANGSMIAVLDACLVTGFNNKAVQSINVAAGVAAVACNGHGYVAVHGKDVLISGATPAELNGRKEVLSISANGFTYASTSPPGTATGTITARRDSLGFVKQFTGVNKAIYKRSDVTASAMKLRVDDAGFESGVNAYVFGVEAATDVDTFTNTFPAVYRWSKGSPTASAKQWCLIGDGKMFYIITQSGTAVAPFAGLNDSASCVMSFGDFESYKPADAFNCMITGETGNGGGAGTSAGGGNIGAGSNQMPLQSFGITIARAFSQLGSSINSSVFAYGSYPSGTGQQFAFPSPIDFGYVLNTKTLLTELVPGGSAARGVLPGFVQVLGINAIDHYEILSDVLDLPGRKLLGLRVYAAAVARVAFDITGPWR